MRPTHIRHASVFPQVNDSVDNIVLVCEPTGQYRTAFLDQVIGRLSSKRVLPLGGNSHNAAMAHGNELLSPGFFFSMLQSARLRRVAGFRR